MTNVIDFKDRAGTLRRPARAGDEHGAMGRVLLFTGVRYERLSPASMPSGTTPPTTSPTTTSPRRAKP